ncbi:MAG: phenylacetate--CoA ligase family protein [Candidatus Cloacimonetes bacterium]|nr:phenylacetate--CoA ligase family protein [Candidatus Cloacimonadota bacterium]
MKRTLTDARLYAYCYLFYKKSIHWSRQQVIDYHDKKLKEMVLHAGRHVPYYRKLFSEAGIDPERFRGLADLDRIPLLDKETLRTRHKEFVADNADKYYPFWSKTSGSTGTPLNIMLDLSSKRHKQRVIARAVYWAGAKRGGCMFKLKGLSESKPKDYDYEPKENLVYLNSSRLTKENCLAAAKLIQLHQPRFFIGYARSFVDFHKTITEAGLSIPNPVGILCEGETITPAIRAYVEEAYQTHIFDQYGNIEGSAMACEMPDHKRYLMEDFFLPELIDADGKASANGYGELVGTSFHNYAMPFIRYKTRDYVKLAPAQDKNFREVLEIEGRMDDCLLMPDGRKIYFAEGALGYADGIVAAQYIQDEIDHLTVNLIVDSHFQKDSFQQIEEGLRKRIGNQMRFSFKVVPELEKKGSGKTAFIINRIQHSDL